MSFAQGKQGCGFSSGGGTAVAPTTPDVTPIVASPPDATTGSGCGAVPDPNVGTAPTPIAAPVTGGATSGAGVINTSAPGSQNVGKGDGSQFITGQCFSDADCASGCCAKLKGKGQCSGPAVSFDAGKEGCGFVNA